MENKTANSSSEEEHQLWVMCLPLSLSLLTATTYFMICEIIVFSVKLSRRQIPVKFGGCDTLQQNLPLVMHSCLISSYALATATYTMASLPITPIPPRLAYTAATCFILALGLVYIVLWLRQVSFYINPTLAHFSNKFVRCLSLAKGLGIIAITIVAIVMTVLQEKVYTAVYSTTFYVTLSFQLEGQLVLLGLFAWPLLKHRQQTKRFPSVAARQHDLMRTIRRAAFATVVSWLLDFGTFVAGYLVGNVYPYIASPLLNLICVTFCFADWRERFFPWLLFKDVPSKKPNENNDGLLKA